MHAETETDGQRKQDKKPHHLLLYLLDLISGVNNIGQKYKTKENETKEKKTTRKQKIKSSELLSNIKTEYGQWGWHMGVSAVTRLTNGNCVPLYWLQQTSSIALFPTTAAYSYYNLSYDLQRNHLSIPNFHGFACITGRKARTS